MCKNSIPQEMTASHDVLDNPDPSPEEVVPDDSEQESEPTPATSEIHEVLSELKTLFETRIARDQSQSKMFDALYREMKDYKNNSLLESLQKPIVKDLMMCYDDFVTIESQLQTLTQENDLLGTEGIQQFQVNLQNFRYQLLEVLYRLDVVSFEEKHGTKLEYLERKLHKAIEVIPTDNPEEDGRIEQIHKIGFYWGEQVIRPEEVSIRKHHQEAEKL